ncbi:MAG: DUF3010 family protein [Mesorhizobium sp.]|nr:DUF3010 family protein [Mesorhizobium sp.]RWD01449.1 MAG: DUF3010 family protein [Mesorhizobium sp.]TKB44615.1 MAG: DUF3010 family protein [Mesorhizobium sp.]
MVTTASRQLRTLAAPIARVRIIPRSRSALRRNLRRWWFHGCIAHLVCPWQIAGKSCSYILTTLLWLQMQGVLRGGNMRICGVQISGSTANLAVVSSSDAGGVTYHPCHTKKITLEDEKSGDSLRAFLKAITAFAHENQVEGFSIKQRASGGQRGAGGPSFKVEALVQLVPDIPTYFANPVALSKFAKTNVAGLPNGLQNYLADSYRSGAFQLKKLGAI